MKITISMKNPDCVWDALEEAGIDPNDRPAKVDRVMRKFVEFDEYITVELDTDKCTAVVLAN